jgi:hypothetical protein
MAAPAFVESSLGDSIESFTNSLIDRTFDDVFGRQVSPSMASLAIRLGGWGVVFPAEATQNLCNNIVQNDAIPSSIQTEIALAFELNCESSRYFFNGFPF